MSPPNIVTLQEDQFYYISGNRTAMLIRSGDRIDFNADKLNFSEVAKRYNLIIEDAKDVYLTYGDVCRYLEKEWGLEAKTRGVPLGDQTMFALESINDDSTG